MEEGDFGFVKRDDSILRNVNVVDEEEDKGNKCGESSSVAGVSSGNKLEGTVGGHGPMLAAPLSRASEAGNIVPERTPAASSSSSASSVVFNPPNIPNVVEYHLKVKPGQRKDTALQQRDNSTKTQEEMKKENGSIESTDKRKDFITKLSRLSINNNVFEGSTELPQVFQVKYLGSHDARGLWGIKHTRKPVDNMVAAAKALPSNTVLPLTKLIVSGEGVTLFPLEKGKQELNSAKMYGIETISYGVQDLVYTRVFSMIVVRETENFRRVSPFECHGFVCESKHHARQLTYALAAAFDIYSRSVKAQDKMAQMIGKSAKRRFAIDLRSPEEIEADLAVDSEA